MIRFHHAPWSRGSGVLWLLEELGIEYDLVHEDIRAAGGAPDEYRAIQPNKKVPAIEHDGTVVTERAAITIYLAAAFPDAGLDVSAGDPDRARFLTWSVYSDSVFDPAVAARAHGYSYKSNDFSFGLFDDMVANVERHLKAHDFAAGKRFTAADTQLASAVNFTMNVLNVLPKLPAFEAYVARIADRPAYRRAQRIDYDLAMTTPYFQQFKGAGASPVDG
jgi:glutathione S-transferase